MLQNRCAKTVVHPGGKAREKEGKRGGEAGEERGFNEAGAHPMALMTLINCTKDGDQPLCTSHGNKRNLEEVLLTCLSLLPPSPPLLSPLRQLKEEIGVLQTRLLRVPSSYFLFIRPPVTASLTAPFQFAVRKRIPNFEGRIRKIISLSLDGRSEISFKNLQIKFFAIHRAPSRYMSTPKNDKEREGLREMGRVARERVEALSTGLPRDTKTIPFSTNFRRTRRRD